ncbi:MAG: UDP-N-acetylmuramoyl-L-alanyl-D-glutamate--2,6-diaminopimelate ligase [Sulfuricurvum sp. GWF2_44_89]|uniref:UDP-N-acetylmuramoyl-L-alanyl-D-glutamate--2, 6-diaminopimelate ligase n=1 Tax=unclassified Sulfuricurvum TaxID=2632390 RepID=UPI0008D5D0B3|nr:MULTISPECIES: UDP-N-acetylmuramoyl-L-alanyl-D-glutamate--2,6-diaminopimelate ligase [unclassified Sulfuricurvum]OHD77763.1 MAG: UDP-N-acetylmuramoyl-L-alanyl-D-glutamate--2,6-diaminopimelate ligase [Sulfuricurvum sp. GWF2_44_89]OHD94881.1 MAG: UDP-N-acetylmuramoyl-L-alanyl-D-glutamate--2,6-diaminopimelate ligase [Sulfuricurvum sp. RIFOXYD12_FULL_44_77]OHD95481.1 MAG: UDP-N-acetylmuramoyl-L-alanyl-D-glutamate--2,6-diaminopimelate ligase [Sulfuricurvum sp. RIFOXYD2_FULL_44_160]
MKIEIEAQPYRYISENSSDCGSECAFLITKQNERYKEDAIARGAHSIITPDECWKLFGLDRICVIGITGTNGKTTTASAIYSLMLDLGHKAAMQGTRGFFMNDAPVEGKTLTTPSVLNTYRHMAHAIAAGCEYFIMEVSSHAIEQERIAGITFGLKVLTNITQDHLDYHESIEEYTRIKNLFFQDETKKLINKDEAKAQFNFKNAFTYGVENPATYKIIAYSLNNGVSGVLKYFEEHTPFASSLHGFFNLYNITAAMAAVHLVTEESLEKIADAVENFGGVSGRMEVVSENPLVIVDFAHTPDGMEQVLNALKEKEVLVVFGAGGDRDRTKRPMMGRVASSYAKKVYVTSDNPRFEDPDTIIEDILAGIEDKSNVYVDVNRRSAIAQALKDRSGDEVVLILGKGDETSQIIYDQHLPFDDRSVAKELLAQM